jgi:succinate dehydrogenase / fumarate reductase, cytochrome b subunit
MSNPSARPLSPHLSIWKWGPAMAVSIAHRMSGIGLATLGVIVFTWWVMAASGGKESYDVFLGWMTPWYGKVVLVGLTWAFFQHLFSGLRHFILDIGAGYELNANKMGSILVFVFAVLATVLAWGLLYGPALLKGAAS